MTAVSDARLLDLWEAQRERIPLLQALELLATAWPEVAPEHWAGLTLGRRDGHLLRLHSAWFGGRFELALACGRCGEALELEFDAADIRAPAPETAGGGELEAAGYRLRCRPPTSADLLAVAALGPGEAAQSALLERCVEVVAAPAGAGTGLPEAVRHAAEQAMAQADPQAEVSLAVSCPGCGHRWSETFDILAYLWDEIDQWAKGLLREVHLLAAAYGWSEGEILALSPARRRIYLELNGA